MKKFILFLALIIGSFSYTYADSIGSGISADDNGDKFYYMILEDDTFNWAAKLYYNTNTIYFHVINIQFNTTYEFDVFSPTYAEYIKRIAIYGYKYPNSSYYPNSFNNNILDLRILVNSRVLSILNNSN